MGSGASTGEVHQPVAAEPEAARPSTPAARSDDPPQEKDVDDGVELEETCESHALDVQSVKSEDSCHQLEQEVTSQTAVSPAAASFLHNNGTLYSCFSHHGNRVYVDESQNLQPFPSDWFHQGRFVTSTSEGSTQMPSGGPAVLKDDDRTGSVYIHGRGTVATYMFEEKLSVCRFWDRQSGLWLLLPLQWEVNTDLVQNRVQRVLAALPGLSDQMEITAALRQCNYDIEEVMSVFLTMFGDILLQPGGGGGGHSYNPHNSFRALLEREQVIEELKKQLQSREKELHELLLRNSSLLQEVRYLTDVVQHLRQKGAELEADQQEARQKIRSLLSRCAPPPPLARTGPGVDPERFGAVSRATRYLNVSGKQLRSDIQQVLSDHKKLLQQLRDALEELVRAEEASDRRVEELRTLYRTEAAERRSLHNRLLELQGNIRVFCRCRNTSSSTSCLETDDEDTLVHTSTRRKFHFDKVFSAGSSQEEVFAVTLPIITSCVDGYNVCILAYGQTGSGKTFTMTGSKEEPGVNVRSIRELLRLCGEKDTVTFTLKISMLEIYNDALNDLLTRSAGAALDVRDQGKTVSVPGLTQVQVRTEGDILRVMETGEKNRKMASTKMNIHSSRSHLLVALEVSGSDPASGLTTRGTLTLCDLAGSERISRTEAEGRRLVEAAAINKSLTALGQVFVALKSNSLHIPFRNSRLTHLLKPSLSGDAKCCVFLNVSPDPKDAAETLSTLQFGSSIRQVALGVAPRNVGPSRKK